jgi:integrase
MPRLDPTKVAALVKASAGEKLRKHSDGQSLYLLTRDGLGWWQYQWREGATSRSKMLGSAADMSPARARAIREELASDRRRGITEQRRGVSARHVSVTSPTRMPRRQPAEGTGKLFGDLVTDWLAETAAKRTGTKEAAAYVRTLGGALALMPVADIDTPDVERHLAAYMDKPQTWKKTLVRIEKILNFATVRNYRTGANPARWKGLFEHLPGPTMPNIEHHGAMPAEDVSKLMRELVALDTPASRSLAFLILTAARSEEVRGMRWDEIKGTVWTCPAIRMKGREGKRKAHSVPLSPAAIKLLGKRGNMEYVFQSPYGDDKPIGYSAMRDLLRRLRPGAVDANGKPLKVHGMRTTFAGDWAAKNGFSMELRELALAHVVGDPVFQTYNRDKLIELRRPMMLRWSKFATGK